MKRRDRCRICQGDDFQQVINLGPAPLANSYREEDEFTQPERFYPLVVYRCRDCGLVQLRDIVPQEQLFGHYPYVAGETSDSLPEHFDSYAKTVLDAEDDSNPFVVGIGSNDGTLLRAFQKRGAAVLGVDPAENIVSRAESAGVETVNAFFEANVAANIRDERGPADIVVANNVLGHVDDLHNVIDGISTLLHPSGRLIFEVPYLPDLMEKRAFDTIYHEHRSYFHLTPLERLFQEHDMRMMHITHTSVQGGSIRVTVRNNPEGKTGDAVQQRIRQEEQTGMGQDATYDDFAASVEDVRHTLCQLLHRLRADGATIVGYGAPAKAAILLNYCNLGVNEISYAVDEIGAKQGRHIPGTRIPITTPETFRDDAVDYALLLAWNYEEEILEKEQTFRENGGRFIRPVPEPKIL